MTTSIDGYETAASVATLMSVAPLFRLTHEDAVAMVAEVLAATSRWGEVAANHGLPEAEITEMAWAFEHAETDAALALIAH